MDFYKSNTRLNTYKRQNTWK